MLLDMKRNVLILSGAFILLLYGCGTQNFRTSSVDDGLYFDARVEASQNRAKAAEREVKSAELKAATETAIARQNTENQTQTDNQTYSETSVTNPNTEANVSQSTTRGMAQISTESNESQYAKSFIFDDPAVVVVYRDRWADPWLYSSPSWSFRYSYRPYWRSHIYFGISAYPYGWYDPWDPFYYSYYDNFYGYGGWYGGWYGSPHYGHPGHYHGGYYGGYYNPKTYSSTKRERMGANPNGGGMLNDDHYMGVNSYSSGPRNNVGPSSSSHSGTQTNTTSVRRSPATTPVSNEGTKNETPNNTVSPRRNASAGSITRPSTISIDGNTDVVNNGYRRPAGNVRPSSGNQVYTRPSSNRDTYNPGKTSSQPVERSVRRSTGGSDNSATKAETQTRKSREFSNSDYNSSPRSSFSESKSSSSESRNAPSSGGSGRRR